MICNYCGEYYEGKDARTKYCSEECKKKMYMRNNREKKVKRIKVIRNNKAIDEINKKAYEKGISYGQYVAKYGK